MERLHAWREKKLQERVMTSSHTPPSVSLSKSPLLESPVFSNKGDILQLDGDASNNDERSDTLESSDFAVDRSDNAVDRSNDVVDENNNAVDRGEDAVNGSDDALDASDDARDLSTLQQLCKPPPRKVYNPAGRKHIPQNHLYKSPTFK